MAEIEAEVPAVPTDAPALSEAPTTATEVAEKVAEMIENAEQVQQVAAAAAPVKRYEPVVSEDAEVTAAKSYLQTYSDKAGTNLYDHLTRVMLKLLETRPGNAVDIFESLSAEVKRSKFQAENPDAPGAFQKAKLPAQVVEQAKSNVKLFEAVAVEDPADAARAAEEGAGELPDILDLSNMWEWAGLSFGKEETFTLFLSLRNLVEQKQLKSVRLWGKIVGTQKDYIIAEAELKEGNADEDDVVGAEKPEDAEANKEESKEDNEAEGANKLPDSGANITADFFAKDADLPKSKHKPTPAIPKEERTGVNKYVYYVCHYAGGQWFRLPDVTPEQLQSARKIRKYFTGDLLRKITSYPPFNGLEAHYLRAQIARISAATVVSPAGYYIFDQEEGGDEENEQAGNVIINPEFEGVSHAQLLDPANWVHHTPYILPQGRTTWENPLAKEEEREDDGEERDEDEEDTEGTNDGSDRAEPESGPALLSALANDEEHFGAPSWTSRVCSRLSPLKYSPVVLRSARWPGAHAIAYGDKFVNIYLGDGQKDLGNSPSFFQPLLPAVQKEYATEGATGNVADVTELNDPTVEEEKAFEEQQKEKEEEEKEAAEEGEEEDQ